MKRDKTRVRAATIYLRAADYIRRHGWQVSGMGLDGQARCSMGALNSAYPASKWDQNLSSIMYDTLRKELNGMSLTQFNYKVRDGNKVAQLYERAAIRLLQRRSAY